METERVSCRLQVNRSGQIGPMSIGARVLAHGHRRRHFPCLKSLPAFVVLEKIPCNEIACREFLEIPGIEGQICSRTV